MQQHAAEKRLLSRQRARKRKHAELGIMYKFDKVEYVSTAVPRVPSVLKRHYLLVEEV